MVKNNDPHTYVGPENDFNLYIFKMEIYICQLYFRSLHPIH